jgi:hypothetical protein
LTNKGAQQGGFIMFRHVTQELLNIEKICKRKLKDTKNKKFRKIAKFSSYC